MNYVRAPDGAYSKKKKPARFAQLIRKLKTIFSYRIGLIRPRDREREAIESVEEFATYLAAVKSGTEFRWATEHLVELITALETSPHFQQLPGITARDLRAFNDLRRALWRTRQCSAVNDRSDYADYVEGLLSEAAKRSRHVRPLKSKSSFAKIDGVARKPSKPRVSKKYGLLFYVLLGLIVLYFFDSLLK